MNNFNENSTDKLALAFRALSDLRNYDRKSVLARVTQNGLALQYASDKLKNNISFFWAVWHLKNSKSNDDIRQSYMTRFLLKEIAKFLGATSLAVVSGLFLAEVITLPIPALAVLIAGALIEAISGLYAIHKIYQHTHGFFKGQVQEPAVAQQPVARLS